MPEKYPTAVNLKIWALLQVADKTTMSVSLKILQLDI